jgi:signal transduction histidine kinase
MDLRFGIRLLALFGAVAIPPLVALAAIVTFQPGWVAEVGTGTALLLAVAGGTIWAGIIAVLGSRAVGHDVRELIEIAERGVPESGPTAEALSAGQRRLAATLDERNREIASLAAAASAVPISGTAGEAAASVVALAREVTGDPTWQLAVLRSPNAELLPPGVYTPETDAAPDPLSDLHRWAAASEAASAQLPSAGNSRHVVGPWGAFQVVAASTGEQVSAILFAPREGRVEPTRAELDLSALIGERAATTIEHALLYAQVRQQADELNRMAAIQSDFLRGVTHDLQTPLTSIRALAAELAKASELDDDARSDLDSIAHQADRLRRMVSQLLVASRIEAGVVSPGQEVFREEPLVRRTWEALRADRPFELLEDGPPHLAVADPDRLEQVLWAVLDNAVKYSPAGSRVSVALYTVSANPGQLESVIEVADEGAGMSPESVEHAFEQFFRADDARRLAPDGSGVGLYAARGLMRAMGGDIRIESRLGAGTRVIITLPAEEAESAA